MGAFDCALDVATSTLSRSNGQQIIPLAVGASKIEQNVVLRRNCPHRDGSSPTLVQCGLPCGVLQGVNCLPGVNAREKSGSESPCSAIARHLSIHYVRHVSAFAEKLHHFLAGSRQLRPTGLRIRILLKSANFLSVENEIHLSQTKLGSPTNRVTFSAYLDGFGVFHEGLPPDLDECFVE